ncbi:hypothetical protein D4A39_08050 [Alcanivorax profundi]|uniref:Lipoprotein n=1 Tax=Alcanivorax profundi TaxID=2338368 RepID=A0A418XZG2_9GAMM|nr:hypothetical protein [Alcanivorax profundi]RJG18415.1 hypothetical protein D4A39_08050 [Alcanivorax profundi]
MKDITVLGIVMMLLAGCSGSVRQGPVVEQEISPAMLARTQSLGLPLSSQAMPRLANALAQAQQYCQLDERELKVEVRQQSRGGDSIPVVKVDCE